MSTAFPSVADPVANMLGEQVVNGIAAIVEANETLLASEDSSTGVREIDKALKDYIPSETNDVSEKDKDIVKAVAALEKARKAFKSAQENARNLYRVNVLHEDEVTESDVDEDALKEQVKAKRKMVMEAITLLGSYAEGNGLTEVLNWTKNLSVPQVGRQGASTVGQKKPRAYVSVNDKTFESFGEAAKAVTTLLSTDDNKVEVSSPDLVSAWVEAGEKDSFDYQGLTIKVTPKESKAKAA
jgi:negative regulator of replication initiation